MAIIHFTFDTALGESFVHFGYALYSGDTSWIPPFKKELRAQLSPEFGFYGKQGNLHRHFLATAGKNVVGRVSAMVNTDLRDKDRTPVGTVGFFECIHDYAVAKDLLEAATGWLHEEMGMNRIWGPMNFDIWHGYRFMTKGFDQKIFYGEPYNKPYYHDFFLRSSFIDKYYWDTVEITGRETLQRMVRRGAERHQQLVAQGYRFEPIRVSRFKDELRKLHSVLTASFRDFLGYTHIPFEEFERLFAEMRYAVHSRFVIFAYDENNVLAGFAGALLELSDAIRSMEGEGIMINKLKFLYRRRFVKRINFYIGGITPDEAVKGSGLGRAGFSCVLQQILKEGYETVLFTLRARRNVSHGLLGRNVPLPQREYALYEWNS